MGNWTVAAVAAVGAVVVCLAVVVLVVAVVCGSGGGFISPGFFKVGAAF